MFEWRADAPVPGVVLAVTINFFPRGSYQSRAVTAIDSEAGFGLGDSRKTGNEQQIIGQSRWGQKQ